MRRPIVIAAERAGTTPAALSWQTLTRAASAVTQPIGNDRTFSTLVSTEAPFERAFGTEVLSHAEGAIDMSRLTDGSLPLMSIHNDREMPLGVARNFELTEEGLRCDICFAETERAEEPVALQRAGVPLGVSVGYSPDWEHAQYDESTNTVRFMRWQLLEVSIAPIQADGRTILGRNLEGREEPMPTPTNPTPPAGAAPAMTRGFESGREAGVAAGIEAERVRHTELMELFALGSVRDTPLMRSLRDTALADGWSVAHTQRQILENIGEANQEASLPASTAAPASAGAYLTRDQASMRPGADQLDGLMTAATATLLYRGQIDRSDETHAAMMAGGLGSYDLSSLAREFLRQSNNDGYRENDIGTMVGRAFSVRSGGGGLTTADFPAVLSNVANRALLLGWGERPETWRAIARSGSLPDFRPSERAGLSHFSNLDEIAEDGEMTFGKLTDFKEPIQLVEYGKKLRLGRRVIINDDLGAFTRAPRLMGRAASRAVGDALYDALTQASGVGPTLEQTGLALFEDATHKNIGTTGGISFTTMDEGFVKLGTQLDPLGEAILQISPSTLLVPKALEATARAFVAAEKDPAIASGEGPNVFKDRVTVVAEARLDAKSPTRWYLMGDPSMDDLWEVAFLNGVEEPYFREEQEWDSRGALFAIGLDAGVAALDYRAQFTNAGA